MALNKFRRKMSYDSDPWMNTSFFRCLLSLPCRIWGYSAYYDILGHGKHFVLVGIVDYSPFWGILGHVKIF